MDEGGINVAPACLANANRRYVRSAIARCIKSRLLGTLDRIEKLFGEELLV
jgi:hypothetical protein